jgi:hypothetical protein
MLKHDVILSVTKITQSKREGEYQVWRRSRSCNINAADGWSVKNLTARQEGDKVRQKVA